MTSKPGKTQAQKESRVKVDKLEVNKETVKDLSDKDAKDVKGGMLRRKAYMLPVDPEDETALCV